MVIFLIQKLDKVTQAKWEERCSINVLPSRESLVAFLEQLYRSLENVVHALQTQVNTFGKIGKTLSTYQKNHLLLETP